MSKKYKYESEYGITLKQDACWVISSTELYNNTYEMEGKHFSLYAICKRPKVSIIEDSVLINGDQLRAKVKVGKGIIQSEAYIKDLLLKLEIEDVEQPFYHELIHDNKTIIVRDTNGKLVFQSRASTLFQIALEDTIDEHILRHEIDETLMVDIILDTIGMEVLYIGKAYGENGSREAFDRLKKHETLQKIVIDLQDSPGHEAWIVMISLSEEVLITEVGPNNDVTAGKQASKEHTQNMVNLSAATLSREQLISAAEAALIRYFSTKYNVEYNREKKFPHKDHKKYSEIYNLDCNMFSLVFCTITEDVAPKIYGKFTPKNAFHFLNYPFDENRKYILDSESEDTINNIIDLFNKKSIKIMIPHIII